MTVPKRRITRTETELRAISDIAEWGTRQWVNVEATAADLAHPLLRAAGSSDGHGSDVPDPTGAIALSLQTHDELREAVTAALAQLRWIQARMHRVLRDHPVVAREADASVKALRCDGSIDPTCVRNAVKGGLCHACIKRRQRAEARADENVHQYPRDVHPDVQESDRTRVVGLLSASAVVSCPCGWSTTVNGTDHTQALELLAAHKAEAHAA